MKTNKKIVLFAVLAFIIVAGCLTRSPNIISSPTNVEYTASPQYTPQYTGNDLDRKIISTAQLQLEVDNVQITSPLFRVDLYQALQFMV